MKQFRIARKNDPILRPFQCSWQNGASSSTVFRASKLCWIHFSASEIPRSRRGVAVSKNSSGSKSTRLISPKRDAGSGSARVSRVGEDVPSSRTFRNAGKSAARSITPQKTVAARHRNQHARRVRYPDESGVPYRRVPSFGVDDARNISSDLTSLLGNGQTRSKIRSANGFAVR